MARHVAQKPARVGSLVGVACGLPLLVGALVARADDLTIELTGVDGIAQTGALVQLAPRCTFRADGDEKSVEWRDLLSLRPVRAEDSAPPPTSEAPLRFVLTDGSDFRGRIAGERGDSFVVELADGQSVALAPGALRAIVAREPGAAAQKKLDPLLAALDDAETARPETSDLAVVARGDDVLELRGAVKAITAAHVLFQRERGATELKWPRVAGVVFAQRPTRSGPALVRTRAGDIFAGRVSGDPGSGVALQSGVFERLVLPWDAVERIDVRSDRLVFLSDLRPARYEFAPFFDKQWDYARDHTLSGGPLVLGGRRYGKGLLLHSRAELTYRVGKRFARFAATAGVLDAAAPRGVVALRVLGDGAVLWEAAGVRAGEPPRSVLVALDGVDELTLVVDYDDDLDLGDHAVWAFARLIRPEE